MAGGQGGSSPDRLPRGERISPLGGARQWGEQGEAAQAFCTFGPWARTIFAKQSLVSTLTMKWPTGGSQFGFILIGRFARTGETHGIRDHASKEARQHGLSGGLDAALLPGTEYTQR